MITLKLKLIFLISIMLFIIHGIEEYLTHFYDIYPLLNLKWTNSVFTTIPQATFLTFQLMWWLLLLSAYILMRGGKGLLYFLTFIGIVYLYEITHILSAIIVQGYTPGLGTGMVFPIIAFLYWKELLRVWSDNIVNKKHA